MPLDDWLPSFDVSERHETAVDAPPASVYASMRSVNPAASGSVRFLFAVRGLPRAKSLDDFLRPMNFVVLEERVGEEFVFGLIGRFWRPRGALVSFAPGEFAGFEKPGYAKGATTFLVQPYGSETLISTETRVQCTDEASLRSFKRYWRLIGPFSGYIRTRWLAAIKRDAEANSRTRPPSKQPSNPEHLGFAVGLGVGIIC